MASGSANTVFGKGGGSSKNRVDIPKFLRPFYKTAAGEGTDAITTLSGLLAPGNDFVAGFTPEQELAQLLGTDRALGGGDFFPTMQNLFLDTAQGTPVSDYIPQNVLEALGRAVSGGVDDSGAVDTLSGVSAGLPESIERLLSISGGSVPDDVYSGIRDVAGRDVLGMDALSQIEGGINADSRGALEATARGDYLFGGTGYDEAIDAAMRRIRPEVATVFGGAGPGGATGGLAKTAIAQAVADTFAGQYSQERGRQLGAANSLAGLDFTDRGQRADIAGLISNLGLTRDSRDLSAAGSLADISLTEAGQNAGIESNIASLAASLGMDATQLLASLGERGRDRSLSGSSILSQLGGAERDRQIAAGGMLPSVAEADLSLLSRIGQEQQGLSQAEMDAPRNAQAQLLSMLLGVPFQSLLGNDSTFRNWNFAQQAGVQGGFALPGGG